MDIHAQLEFGDVRGEASAAPQVWATAELTALGAGQQTRNWRRPEQVDRRERYDGVTRDEREELTRLRRENTRLKQERALLKRAAAVFGPQSAIR